MILKSINRFTTPLLILLLTITATMKTLAQETGQSPGPTMLVESFHTMLTDSMKMQHYSERYDVLLPYITDNFDISGISRVILGRHWSELEEQQQAEFISLYARLVTSTYASRFDSFSGEKFTFQETEDLNRGRKLVKTVLTTSDGEKINLDYLIHQKGNRWMIISVIANGANDISIKRGEYADVIERNGYPALLDEIKSKINEMMG